jgi:hypothetical protein
VPSARALSKKSNLTSKNNVIGIIRRKVIEAESFTNEVDLRR